MNLLLFQLQATAPG